MVIGAFLTFAIETIENLFINDYHVSQMLLNERRAL